MLYWGDFISFLLFHFFPLFARSLKYCTSSHLFGNIFHPSGATADPIHLSACHSQTARAFWTVAILPPPPAPGDI